MQNLNQKNDIIMDPTELRDRAIGQIEKQYHIDRMRMLRKNWSALKNTNRVREIDFKLTLLHKTRPEDFLNLDQLTETVNAAWEKNKSF